MRVGWLSHRQHGLLFGTALLVFLILSEKSTRIYVINRVPTFGELQHSLSILSTDNNTPPMTCNIKEGHVS